MGIEALPVKECGVGARAGAVRDNDLLREGLLILNDLRGDFFCSFLFFVCLFGWNDFSRQHQKK